MSDFLNFTTAWQRTWRRGVAPQLSTAALLALRDALIHDDPGLIQGATTEPPPLQAVQDQPCEGACLIGFAGWRGEHKETVGEVEEFFCSVVEKAGRALGEQAAARYLLNAYDDWERAEMIRNLLPEVEAVLTDRGVQVTKPAA